MKKTLYLTLILMALLVGQSGCSLDEKLYGIATTEGFVKTEADATFVINGVYANYQDFLSFKSSAAGLMLYSGDEFAFTGTVGTNMAGVWINRLFTSSDSYVTNTWNNFFAGVNKANSAIETMNAAPLSDAFKTRINGELTFMRAFSYYYLVRLFGGVPVSVTATKPGDNFYKSRQPVDSVYAQIFRDLKNASAKCLLLSKQPASEFGRATKGAAQAMLAQAYLTYGNYCDLNGRAADAQLQYQQAVNWADSVLLSKEYSLISNYADLYDVSKEKAAYKEVIYGIQFTRDALASGAGSKGSEWAYYTQPSERWAVCGNALPKGNGHGGTKIQPWFAEQYFTGDYAKDYRAEVSFLTGWSGYTTASTPVAKTYNTFPAIAPDASDLVRQTMCYLNKYVDPKGVDQRNNENDYYVIRLAEVYLIKAEALNELGRTTEAYVPFNELRKRARLANGTARTTPLDLAAGLDKENFRLAVFNERGLELVGEGQRFFDMVRMRYPNTNTTMMQWRMETFYPNLPSAQKALPSWDSSSKTWKGGRVYTPNVVPWNVRFLLYPIPNAEFDSNPNIGTQNPGW